MCDNIFISCDSCFTDGPRQALPRTWHVIASLDVLQFIELCSTDAKRKLSLPRYFRVAFLTIAAAGPAQLEFTRVKADVCMSALSSLMQIQSDVAPKCSLDCATESDFSLAAAIAQGPAAAASQQPFRVVSQDSMWTDHTRGSSQLRCVNACISTCVNAIQSVAGPLVAHGVRLPLSPVCANSRGLVHFGAPSQRMSA